MTDEVDPPEWLTSEHIDEGLRYIEDMGADGVERMAEMVLDYSEDLRDEWSRIRKRRHNPSKKGDAFEATLVEFLEVHFSSVFKFRRGCSLMDSDLRCFKHFEDESNEFDVVASYRTAIPHVIFEEGGMYWLPYDGVAFLCEVKSSLTKPALKHDLRKLEKLAELRGDPSSRFGFPLATPAGVDHQLHCLAYDKNEISRKSMKDLLMEFPDAWDMMLIVEEDLLYINSTLPFAEVMYGNETEDQELAWCHVNRGLLWFVITLTTSISHPVVVDTTTPLIKMGTFWGLSKGGGTYRQNPD